MRILTIEQMKERKQVLGYSNEQLALLSGVPESTIQKIFSGTTRSPRHRTLEKLDFILRVKENHNYDFPGSSTGQVAESTEAYTIPKKKQGEYTVEDYEALPDERRVELIDGVIYDLSAPTTVHQVLQGEIYFQLRQYIHTKGGTCIPMISPTDVQIDMDEFTMVQPDVFVICNREIITRKRIFGAPDFIIEILSPSTRTKDATIKWKKYLEAGVREYWLVDPMKEKILVYNFTDEDTAHIPTIYGFQDNVPVAILDGDCLIDFSLAKDGYAFMPE